MVSPVFLLHTIFHVLDFTLDQLNSTRQSPSHHMRYAKVHTSKCFFVFTFFLNFLTLEICEHKLCHYVTGLHSQIIDCSQNTRFSEN